MITLPWVSRARLAAAEAALEAERSARARLEGEVACERARYTELVGTLVELKREGFSPPARPELLEPHQVEVPEVIQLAIGRRALPHTELERELLKWAAAEMRHEGADPDQVAKQILRGGSTDEEE
jgi:hypothetical protein